ncbi:MAG: SUMF1/EgtB/PvdO family nonheme iron enzyme [Ardenticatenales bacterium]|nr:SUMF1/EgtB/PvdO family nonheme iron enzyme [Ardenticatenales bacterium]
MAGALLAVPLMLLTTACRPDVDPIDDRIDHGGAADDDAARRDDAHGIAQVHVPPGTFRMGTSAEQAGALSPPGWAAKELESEQPQHDVRLSRGFWIDTFEVTNAAFQAFVDAGGYADDALWSADGLKWLDTVHRDELPVDCVPDALPDHPRVCVTWHEAEAYARWRGGRLPTEAEWELAARGPESRVYPWGDAWDPAKANVVDSDGLTAVGSSSRRAQAGSARTTWRATPWSGWRTGWMANTMRRSSPRRRAGRSSIRPGRRQGRSRSRRAAGGAATRSSRAAYRHFEDGRSYQDHHIGFRVVTDDEPAE